LGKSGSDGRQGGVRVPCLRTVQPGPRRVTERPELAIRRSWWRSSMERRRGVGHRRASGSSRIRSMRPRSPPSTPRVSTNSRPCAPRFPSPASHAGDRCPCEHFSAAKVAGARPRSDPLPGFRAVVSVKRFCDLRSVCPRPAAYVVTLGARCRRPAYAPCPSLGSVKTPPLVSKHAFGARPTRADGNRRVLHHACARRACLSVPCWASVPALLAAAPNPKAALALIPAARGSGRRGASRPRDLCDSAVGVQRQ